MRPIDAGELIEEFARRDTTDGTVKVFSGREICDIILAQPTVDAEPIKHGYWKWNKQYGTECSECGTAMFEVIGHIFSSATPKYCPYCGARMDGVENG